jgi:Flp pilus assembly pilin Flp
VKDGVIFMKKIMFAVSSAKEAAKKKIMETAIILSQVKHSKKDGAVNYLLEIAGVTVVIILAITAVTTKIDFSTIWSHITDALGKAITKATAAFS